MRCRARQSPPPQVVGVEPPSRRIVPHARLTAQPGRSRCLGVSAGKRRRRCAPWRVIPARHRTEKRNSHRVALAAGAVFFAAVLIAAALARRPATTAAPPPPNPPQPRTLAELLAVPAAKLGQVDLALMNVLCAEGLPGAANLDPQSVLGTLDSWARRVDSETARHLYRFQGNPAEFNNSEGYFRALMLIVVTQEDFGVRYNPARIVATDAPEPDEVFFADSRDLFLHGIASPRAMGTCISMPVFYAAIGRRLGYPIRLALAKNHLFARWEGTDRRDRFNIEATSRGLNTFADDYYKTWPHPMTDEEVSSGHFLKSLSPAEELAIFLQTRGHCLKASGRPDEAKAAYLRARAHAPLWPEHDLFVASLGKSVSLPVAPIRTQPGPGADPLLAHVQAADRYNRQIMGVGRGSGQPSARAFTPPPTPPPLPPRPDTTRP